MTKRKPVRQSRTKKGEIPKILRNKSRNRAFMLIEGRRYYLGVYNENGPSLEAEENRLRLWAEYQAKRGPDPKEIDKEEISIVVLVKRFLEYAKTIYVKNGRSTGSYERFRVTVRPLVKMYGDFPVTEFGPLCLKAVRNVFIEQGLGRKTINCRVGLIRQIFQWGVENELVEETVWRALTAVTHLKEGRTTAPDYPDVEPVPDEIVVATLPFMPPAVAAMVRIQQMTGARPSEICNLRPCDIRREGDVFPKKYAYLKRGLQGIWVYIPGEHKTEHKKKERWLPLGPKCQEIIHSYLGVEPDWNSEEYVFSPEAEQRLRAAQARAKRKTPVQPSQRSRRKTNPKRRPGKKYLTGSYRTAIQRAVKKHNDREIEKARLEGREPVLLPKWFPYQIRHNVATETRAAGEIETAQVLLGHSNMKMTELYAKKNKDLAIQFALKNC